ADGVTITCRGRILWCIFVFFFFFKQKTAYEIGPAQASEERRAADEDDEIEERLEHRVEHLENVLELIEPERVSYRRIAHRRVGRRGEHGRQRGERDDRGRAKRCWSPAARRQMTVWEEEREEEADHRERGDLGPKTEPRGRLAERQRSRHDDQR